MTPQQPIEGHGMSPSVSTAKELLARLVAFDTPQALRRRSCW